jgi:hypothetical protein
MKPLDIVTTPKGAVAVVTETDGHKARIAYIRGLDKKRQHNAWWSENELDVIDSIPRILADELSAPGGSGFQAGDQFFPVGVTR